MLNWKLLAEIDASALTCCCGELEADVDCRLTVDGDRLFLLLFVLVGPINADGVTEDDVDDVDDIGLLGLFDELGDWGFPTVWIFVGFLSISYSFPSIVESTLFWVWHDEGGRDCIRVCVWGDRFCIVELLMFCGIGEDGYWLSWVWNWLWW